MSEWTNSIDRLTRWDVFLTHVNVNCHGVVDTIEKHPETPREPLDVWTLGSLLSYGVDA
jgi:hypothetical protein